MALINKHATAVNNMGVTSITQATTTLTSRIMRDVRVGGGLNEAELVLLEAVVKDRAESAITRIAKPYGRR